MSELSKSSSLSDAELRFAKGSWEWDRRICQTDLSALEIGEFYTDGSTKNEVLLIQGAPDEANESESVLRYKGLGWVEFRDDRVQRWWRDPLDKSREFQDSALGFRTTTLHFSARQLRCGTPTMHFPPSISDHSTAWNITAPLSARLRSGFTLGSTKFNVEVAQGAPDADRMTNVCAAAQGCETSLIYGNAEVLIGSGRVIGWRDPKRALKTKNE